MIKKILKNKLTIFLIIIVIILVIIKIFSSKSNNITKPQSSNFPTSNPYLSPDKNQPTITPTSTPNKYSSYSFPTLTPQETEISDINYQIPLSHLLPYQGKYFRAQRYLDVNNLEIIVPSLHKDQTDLAKKEAQEWLTQNGVDTLDRFTVVYK